MVLDGLAADVEALGDLGVGQPVAEEVEHLGLALGQQAARRFVAGRWSHAERPQHRRRRVGVAGRLQPLERLERGPRLGHRHLGTFGQQRVGELQPGVRHLHRHLRPGEAGERLAQARLRVAGAGGEADPPTRQRGRGQQVVTRVPGGARREPRPPLPRPRRPGRKRRGGRRRAGRAAGRPPCSAGRPQVQGPLEDVWRASDVSPRRGGSPPAGGRASASARRRGRRAAARPPRSGPCRTRRSAKPGQRAATQRALPEAPQPDRFGQRGVGLGPASGGGQDPAVVRAAERRHGGSCRRSAIASPIRIH